MRTIQNQANAWGFGAARLVPAATQEDTELVVFVSDLHIPFEEPLAVRSALKLIKAIKPHRVVINGDVADFVQVSKFNGELDRLDTLQEEVDAANAFRKKVRSAAPNSEIHETEGNHDFRLRKYVAENARALTSLRALEPQSLFLYNELEIHAHPGAGFRLRDNFLVKHGTKVTQHSGYTAKAEYELNGIGGVSGHTHRLATYRRNTYSNQSWTEGGCLCRLDPQYIQGAPNWQQGITVGEFSTKTSNYVVHEVPFYEGRMHLGLRKF